MLLVNVELGDPCVALLEEHEEMPVLAIADASVVGNLPSLSSADADAVRRAVRYLYDLGHRQIARVGGPESLAHSYIRDSAFADVASELGMRYRCLHTDYTPETGREATKRLLAFSEHPTAIIYDNDVMALAGLGVAASQGIKVPEEISIMSWDDSLMCAAAYPNLTAMGRDVVDTGKQAAGLLLKLIGGLLTPQGGRVEVTGETLDPSNQKRLYRIRRRMGMLFQFGALFTDLSVFDNVAFPMREQTDLDEETIRDLVLMKLNAVGLRGAAHLMPSEISGGMARRAAFVLCAHGFAARDCGRRAYARS